MLAWLESFGTVTKVGVEGTGSYGAGLARFLREAHIEVIEVDRPNRPSDGAVASSIPSTPLSPLALVDLLSELEDLVFESLDPLCERGQ